MEKYNRIIAFDYLKLFAIISVIYGHCVQYFELNNDVIITPLNKIYIFIYSFHMPLFMTISGFFSKTELSIVQFIKRKGLAYIVPCLMWGLILMIGENNRHLGVYFACFWFLKSLFICYFICLLAQRMPFLYKLVFYMGCIFVCNRFFQITYMLPAFILGSILKQHSLLLFKKKRLILCLSGFLFAILLTFWRGEDLFYNPPTLYGYFVEKNPFSFGSFYYALFHILIGLVGSMTFVSLFICIFNSENKGTILSKFGQHTMLIYIIQVFLLENIAARYLDFSEFHVLLRYLGIYPLLTCIIIIMAVYSAQIMNRYKVSRLLLLGKK